MAVMRDHKIPYVDRVVFCIVYCNKLFTMKGAVIKVSL